ncbi:NDRG member, variant 2 [Schistosoma haematobium]|nr:NDRG member, variant 2 [Schistosoma haematobium]KAH9588337.1 NDRG member, variant 2 [Schistosoma haematobium]
MLPIMQRSTWVHIDLPGQGDGEEELPSNYVFPPINRLPDAFRDVLANLKIKHVVLFGEGAGANILARFAIAYDNLVLGAILINCTGTPPTFTESLRDKLMNWKLNSSGMNPATESFLIVHRFGSVVETESEVELRNAAESFRQNLRHSINPKNLNKFITSYMQRKNLSESLPSLKCPVLLITGALASHHKKCRQLFEDLEKIRRDSGGQSASSEFVMIDDVSNVLTERPNKVVDSMQYFLQGIGLLSNLKLQKTPMQLNRRMSMEDYDRPLGKTHFISRLSQQVPEENTT